MHYSFVYQSRIHEKISLPCVYIMIKTSDMKRCVHIKYFYCKKVMIYIVKVEQFNTDGNLNTLKNIILYFTCANSL